MVDDTECNGMNDKSLPKLPKNETLSVSYYFLKTHRPWIHSTLD